MQDTENGSGQGWDKRAFSAQVAEWAIAVGDETGASVAHPARPLRRGVGGLAGAEHAHYRLKDAIDQALILRGSLDFDTADDYAGFVRQLVGRRNRLAEGKLSRRCFAYVPCRLIGSLVRKPGAFARYRFREQLFPTMHFRLTYDALGNGVVTWSTCGSCTWRCPPWKPRWTARCRRCNRPEERSWVYP